MKQIILLLIVFIGYQFSSSAQQIRPANSARIYHEIAQLKHLAHVLYVAAHPDDENTRFLAWMVNEKNIRTGYLSLTRGDGGQNILGSEQGAALGLIRTHELLEARKLDGAEQFFTRAIDFGFSKNYAETFKHWNEYMLTHDVSFVFRKFRPDIIICRFPPTAMAGHGQHAVSAIIAAKAFKASGDKSQYTEDLKYAQPWQAKRLLFNAYRFGSANTTSEDMYKLEVGQYNPLLGMGYGELAGISRSIHKSQGAGTPSIPGVQTEYFQLVAGDSFPNSLFDGIDITWNRVNRKEIGEHIGNILKAYDFKHPEKSLITLLDLRKEIASVKDKNWREEKLSELNKIILDASGFMAELFTASRMTTAGSTLPFKLNIIVRPGNIPVKLEAIKWLNGDSVYNLILKNDTLLTLTHSETIPSETPVTEPFWLISANHDGEMFSLPDDSLIGNAETSNQLYAIATLNINDEKISVHLPLSYKKLDPLKGDVVEPLLIVPGVSVEITDKLIITHADGSVHTSVRLHSFKEINNGGLTIYGNNKKMLELPNINLHANTDTAVIINFTPQQTLNASKEDFFIDAEFIADDKKFSRTQNLIQYEHLPTLQYFSFASAKVLRHNWKCTAKKIGYIEGAGDYTISLMRLAGLQVDVLHDADIANESKLRQYDAIVTGVRAVNVEKKMNYWIPALLRYVHNGGTLLMQYNTLQDLSTTEIGPYPFTLSSSRTTEEDAEVKFIAPQNRVLNYPNKITTKDFENWVQERGLYYPAKWDQRYETLFEMHDTGEEPLKSATLYTTYGKGHYIYCSLSLFRQLPAGNKGAIRLFMNMLSVGK